MKVKDVMYTEFTKRSRSQQLEPTPFAGYYFTPKGEFVFAYPDGTEILLGGVW